MVKLKIKILRPVPIIPVPTIPPLGMAVVVSYLRKKKYNVDQDDIFIKFKRFNEKNPLSFISLHPLSDYQRVISHLNGKNDKGLTKILHKLEILSNFSGYDVIVFSIHSHHELATSLLLSKSIKEKYDSKIVFGGSAIFSPLLQNFVAQFPHIDYVVNGYEQDLEILFKKIEGEKIKIQKNKKPYDFKNIPEPDFNGLPLELYSKPLILPYQPNKGCNSQCNFCSLPFYVNSYQEQPIDKIVKDLKNLKEKYQAEYFSFLSFDFNHNKSFVKKLCNQLLKEKLDIKWATMVKPTLNKETLCLMNKVGCVGIGTSLESASEKILTFMKKPSKEHAEKIIKYCHDLGIQCVIDIICGYPYETQEDVNSTISFIKKFKNKAIFKPNLFALEYGSPLFYGPKKYGIINLRFNKKNILSTEERLSYEFDEKNGLKWKDKYQQQRHSFYLIKKVCYTTLTPHLKVLNHILPFCIYNSLANSRIGDYTRWTLKRKPVFNSIFK